MADVIQQTNNAAIAAWLVAILTAWGTLGFEAAVLAAIGYLHQWFKAPKGWRTDATQAAVALLCVGVYYLFHHPAGWWPLSEAWGHDAAMWTLAALGVGSVAGSTKGAPPTNSLA